MSSANNISGAPETGDFTFTQHFNVSATPSEFLASIWPYRHMMWIGPMLLFLAPRFYNTLKNTAFSRAYHMPYSILALHVFISFVDLANYHTQVFLANGAIHPASQIDALICIVQCWTSLYITAQHHLLPKIAMEVTRATFHCMSVQRLFATAMAIRTGDPRWHEASIMLLNNFIWARLLIAYCKMGRFSWKQRYGVGIVGSHLLGMWNGTYPHGIAIYCGLMVVLLNIDGWAKGRDSSVARALRYLGLATPADWYIKVGIDPPTKSAEKKEA
uniref:Sordarin/hypoxysordarin biosynthesis cluster protein P n=1 Tax=Sordaria araneosa TaxID=573841 RepID=SDNP_SORAA|nr:RecName: Full=Sordarin/hypoxysordarin biosynthesis cluster protein P [Sordaria araneosa]BAV32160.1 hypothetical protein [Sordaria araneosa]